MDFTRKYANVDVSSVYCTPSTEICLPPTHLLTAITFYLKKLGSDHWFFKGDVLSTLFLIVDVK